MIFSQDIPAIIRAQMGPATKRFLAENDITPDSIDGYVCHPGGAKVLAALEEVYGLQHGGLAESRAVLRDYGNMLAATVLFVLQRTLSTGAGGRHLLTTLGPGFTAGFAILDVRPDVRGLCHHRPRCPAASGRDGLCPAQRPHLLDAGATEAGRRHYPLFTLLHAGWIAAIAVLANPAGPIDWILVAVYGTLQLARLWVIVSLGRYWTTRIIVPAVGELVRRGPYRFLRHPNYLVVALEIAILPLAFGIWPVALGFSVANLALLAHRIRVEDAALATKRMASDGHSPKGSASNGC